MNAGTWDGWIGRTVTEIVGSGTSRDTVRSRRSRRRRNRYRATSGALSEQFAIRRPGGARCLPGPGAALAPKETAVPPSRNSSVRFPPDRSVEGPSVEARFRVCCGFADADALWYTGVLRRRVTNVAFRSVSPMVTVVTEPRFAGRRLGRGSWPVQASARSPWRDRVPRYARSDAPAARSATVGGSRGRPMARQGPEVTTRGGTRSSGVAWTSSSRSARHGSASRAGSSPPTRTSSLLSSPWQPQTLRPHVVALEREGESRRSCSAGSRIFGCGHASATGQSTRRASASLTVPYGGVLGDLGRER